MVESSGSYYPSMKPPSPTPINPTKREQPMQVPAISLDELNELTKNFSYELKEVTRKSSYDTLVGELKDGRAVKILYCPNFAEKELDNEFLLQVQSISRLEHNNVVQLLSYCIEGNVRALVYEYSTRGSLHDILHGKKGAVGTQPGQALSWAQRVNIALTSAEALEFIREKTELCITHRFIMSSNILLFDNDVAKLIIGDIDAFKSDFDDMINPDPLYYRYRPDIEFYHAPEYMMTGKFSNISNIYSFGIVLLELLTGRKPSDRTPPGNFMLLAKQILKKGKVHQYADPRLGGEYPPEDFAKMAEIAFHCVQYYADDRPSISTVVKVLRSLLQKAIKKRPSARGLGE